MRHLCDILKHFYLTRLRQKFITKILEKKIRFLTEEKFLEKENMITEPRTMVDQSRLVLGPSGL